MTQPPAPNPAGNPNQPAKPPKPPKMKKKGGFTWLVLSVVILGLAALFLLAGDKLRAAFGLGNPQTDEGPDPKAIAGIKISEGAGRTGAGAAVTFEPRNFGTAETKTTEPVKIAPTPTVTQAAKTFKDEAKGTEFLAQAEKALAAMQWDAAASQARRLENLDVPPRLKSRAYDITERAPQIADLFKRLGDRDELTRGWDTHPGLVALSGLSGEGSRSLAVPLADGSTTEGVADDPLGFIASRRRIGEVSFLLQAKNQFIPGTLPDDKIGTVEKVDVRKIIAERTQELAGMADRIRNSDRAADSLAWYDAGKYAFRNRIDGRVGELLERTVALDPKIAGKIREIRAETIIAIVKIHRNTGNKTAEAGWTVSLKKHFSDTEAFKEYDAWVKGEKDRQIQLAKEQDDKRRREEAERIDYLRKEAERKARQGDEEAAAAARTAVTIAVKEATPDPAVPEAVTTPATGPVLAALTEDEKTADALKAAAETELGKLVDMPPTAERSRRYHALIPNVTKAKGIYDRLIRAHKASPDAEMKLIETSKLLFMIKKSPM